MRNDEDAAYFSRRAHEEAVKVRQARARGDHPSVAAMHGELAVRYQARSCLLERPG